MPENEIDPYLCGFRSGQKFGSSSTSARAWALGLGAHTLGDLAVRVFALLKSTELDGKRIVSHGLDQSIRQWDVEAAFQTGRQTDHCLFRTRQLRHDGELQMSGGETMAFVGFARRAGCRVWRSGVVQAPQTRVVHYS